MQIKPKVDKKFYESVFLSHGGSKCFPLSTFVTQTPLCAANPAVKPKCLFPLPKSERNALQETTEIEQPIRQNTWWESGWQLQPSVVMQIYPWMRGKTRTKRNVNAGKSYSAFITSPLCLFWVVPSCVRHFNAKQMSSTIATEFTPHLPRRAQLFRCLPE